jgi:hypothetical protein
MNKEEQYCPSYDLILFLVLWILKILWHNELPIRLINYATVISIHNLLAYMIRSLLIVKISRISF